MSPEMAWFKKTRKPLASSTVDNPSRVPEGLWVKCPDCSQIIYNKDLEKNLSVCPKCGHHFRLSAVDRLRLLLDDGKWTEHFARLASNDPLQFSDTKAYRDRLRKAARRHRWLCPLHRHCALRLARRRNHRRCAGRAAAHDGESAAA